MIIVFPLRALYELTSFVFVRVISITYDNQNWSNIEVRTVWAASVCTVDNRCIYMSQYFRSIVLQLVYVEKGYLYIVSPQPLHQGNPSPIV